MPACPERSRRDAVSKYKRFNKRTHFQKTRNDPKPLPNKQLRKFTPFQVPKNEPKTNPFFGNLIILFTLN